MDVVKPLTNDGARPLLAGKGGELAPLWPPPEATKGISYVSPVASAQIKSSLLFAALYADGLTTISEPRLSRDQPNACLPISGSRSNERAAPSESKGASVPLGQKSVVVPGDLSAGIFLVGASIVPGFR